MMQACHVADRQKASVVITTRSLFAKETRKEESTHECGGLQESQKIAALACRFIQNTEVLITQKSQKIPNHLNI